MRTIPESDWKRFRELHSVALNRACEKALAEVESVLADSSGTPHERYRTVQTLMRDSTRELAKAFDDFRRSTAFYQLAIIYAMGVITQEEISQFTPETRSAVALMSGRPTDDEDPPEQSA